MGAGTRDSHSLWNGQLRRVDCTVAEITGRGQTCAVGKGLIGSAAGRTVAALEMPEGALLISILRADGAEIRTGRSRVGAADMVHAVMRKGLDGEVRQLLLG